MARKKTTNIAGDFIKVISLMPWWAGLVLALISYVVLHRMAEPPVEPVVLTSVVGLAHSVPGTIFRTAAQYGQYLVPFFCLVGACMSALGRRKRANLLDGVAQADDAQALTGMSWQEFEQVVGEWFRRQGYAVRELGGNGPDGGVDLMLHKDGEKFLVQCKQWRSMKVGVGVVRELYGVMAAERVAGGFVVTCGSFTEDAKDFAQGRNVELLDGAKLVRVLRTLSSARGPADRSEPAAPSRARQADAQQCPACGSPMLRRVAKRGANAGQAFLGCSGYPQCKSTLPISGS